MITRPTAKLLFLLACFSLISERQLKAVDPFFAFMGGCTLAGVVAAWLWTDEDEEQSCKNKNLLFGGIAGATMAGFITIMQDQPPEEILDNAQAFLDKSLTMRFEKYPIGTSVPASTAATLLKRSIEFNQWHYSQLLRQRRIVEKARKKSFFNESLSSQERYTFENRFAGLIKRFDERGQEYHRYLVKLQIAQTKLHAELDPLRARRSVPLPMIIKMPANSPEQLHIKIS